MKLHKLITALLLTAAAALPAAAAGGREAITIEQVAAAMNGMGMEITPRQVTLLSDVVATTTAPRLKIQSMQQWGAHRMKVRLNCASADECLPFFVAVNWDLGTAAHQNNSPNSATNSAALPAVKSGANDFVVRSGTLATLLLDSARVHIKVSVICLEGGAPGQVIRVASKDHRQTYTALVVDGTVLKASL